MHDHGGRGGPARPLRRRWRPYLAALVAVVGLALAVAACTGGSDDNGSEVASLGGAGSATSTTIGGSQDDRQQALDWARCMRQHGIDLPDPQVSGDNIGQQLPNRAVRNSATFKAADQACRQHLPNGAQAPPSAQERRQALAFARCLRQHGITNLPDPQITASGIDQPLPRRMDADDPRLKAAERACHQYGGLPPPSPAAHQAVGVASERVRDANRTTGAAHARPPKPQGCSAPASASSPVAGGVDGHAWWRRPTARVSASSASSSTTNTPQRPPAAPAHGPGWAPRPRRQPPAMPDPAVAGR